MGNARTITGFLLLLLVACGEDDAPPAAQIDTPLRDVTLAETSVAREAASPVEGADAAASEVSPVDALLKAISSADEGDEILVRAGAYDLTDLKIRKDLSLKGEGDVVFHSTAPTAKGILNPVRGVSLRVENITFRGAVSPDKNGAGIRHDGDDLEIINCRFENNENGVLATGSEEGVITIQGSRFSENGHGDGYSHGIYVVNAARLEISDSEFVGTRIGHHVKSLAGETSIRQTRFEDGDGRASYALDASKGGDVAFINNEVLQAADADNPAIINYDLTRGGEALGLKITDNRIVNRHRRGRLLRNRTELTPLIADNNIVNERGGSLRYEETPPRERRMQSRTDIVDTGGAPLTLQKPAPKNGARSGLLFGPEFDRSLPALAQFQLENNWRENADGDLVTFGQAFVEGALQPGEPIAARFGDVLHPAQLDVKSLHDDGSIRHGAVTILTPELKSGASVIGALVKEGATAEEFDAVEIVTRAYSFPVALKFYFGDGSSRDFAVDVRAAAIDAFQSAPRWLDGPLVKETRFQIDAAAHLTLRFDVRVYRDGDIRTNIVFSNEKTFSAGRRELLYDVTIGAGDAPAFTWPRVAQHRSSTWRKVFWTGAQSKLHIAHDLRTLIAAGAVAPLDPSIGVSAARIAANDEELKKDPRPLGAALITKYFPTSGGRDDIGLYTQWAAHYLVAQTERSKRVMLANADAGGAIPWHIIDEATGAPASIEDHPELWLDDRGLKDAHAHDAAHRDLYASSVGGWWEDNAHKPSLFSIPWLVTADRYYADELAMQGAFALFGRWPDLREGKLNAIDIGQVRGTAWSLRDVSDAAWLLPDDHSSKDYLRRVLQTSLRLMKEKYVDQRVMKGAGELEGYIEEEIDRDLERISPWQNDYVALSLWLAARRGNGDAAELLKWSENFHAGRVLTPALPINYAAAYVFPARGTGDGPIDNWASLNDRLHQTKSNYDAKGMEGYPNSATGYVGSALAALTAIASTTSDLDAFEALASLVRASRRSHMWHPAEPSSVAESNNYLFSLVMPNGEMILRKNFRAKPAGVDANELLYGDDSQNEINGRGGADALFGFGGDDVLDGGAGDDFISGGAGDDVIDGGAGNDIMAGGAGADVFRFAGVAINEDVIIDFDAGTDRIEITNGLVDLAANGAPIVVSSSQGAIIDLQDNAGSILVKGTPVHLLQPANFMTRP